MKMLVAAILAALLACAQAQVRTALFDCPGTLELTMSDGVAMDNGNSTGPDCVGDVIIANRASGTVTVLDAYSGAVRQTVPLPYDTATEPLPEPMYVVAVGGVVYVGDRANDRIVAFDGESYEVVSLIRAARGVFHMWADAAGNFLWVSCDIDNVLTVIDLNARVPIAAVRPPPATGESIVHDVIVTPDGTAAFATFLGAGGSIVKYDTTTFEVTAFTDELGDDPHVSLTWRNQFLYAPSQDGNQLVVFNQSDLAPVVDFAITGSHGAGMAPYGDYFYTTNIIGGGVDAVWAIRTSTNEVVGEPVSANFDTPHNLVHTGSRLFLTHSGPQNNYVSIYNVPEDMPSAPVLLGEVQVGFNPFGLAYKEPMGCLQIPLR